MSRVLILITVVCLTGMTMLVAQQAGGPTRAMDASAAQAGSPSAAALGPRLEPVWPRFEPTVADSSASVRPLLATGGGDHTIAISTLALVLIGVIVLLVILK